MVEPNLDSAVVEYSESALLTQFAKGLERLNSLETQLKKQGKRINKLQSVVDSLEAKCVREPRGSDTSKCLRSAGSKRRHSDDEFKQPLSAFSLLGEHPA